MLKPGDRAPDFELPSADLEMTLSANFVGKNNMVLYFYPKDTPAAPWKRLTSQISWMSFRRSILESSGISRDNCLCHGDFRDKHGLTILLLADIDGVLSEPMMYGGKRGPW